MSNISFDNPWLLFIGLPLLAAVIVPFAVTIRRDNANAHNIASFCLHVLICLCITLAISGMAFETVITETNVFVLADISYSANHNLDEVQENIEKISDKLPKNSKMGVICFGRNHQMIADLGEEVPDVASASKVDRSATDIASALRYAGNLFDDNVIKRIIVITDGVETVAANNIIRVVNALQDNDVYVDAVFLDDNLDESVSEVQIDGVEATRSTYVGKAEEVEVLVMANCGEFDGVKSERTNGYVNLFRDGELVLRRSASFYDGLNVVTLPLYTEEEGIYNYEVTVETVDLAADTSSFNNNCLFTQKVTDERKVLFIGGSEDDCYAGMDIYGREDVTYVSEASQVPLSVEELCIYDEIVLCNFDVRKLQSATMFTSSLTALVDDYGKTLTTFGNTFVQEDTGEDSLENQALRKLADLLPVNIGNPDQDTRLIAFVFDISLSMNFEGRFNVAKRAAVKLLDVFNPTDMVMIVGFSGGVTELLPPTYLTSPSAIKAVIESQEAENGTDLSAALKYTYETMPTRFHNKQVIIISDGMNNEGDNELAINLAKKMTEENISVSAIGIYPKDEGRDLLDRIVFNGFESGDKVFCQHINNEDEIDVVIGGVTDEASEIEISGDRYEVSIRRPGEEVVDGVENIGAIGGFWYNWTKDTATTVLTAKYFRDKGVTSFDVPIYAYWSGGGKGKVVSFMSDISSNWTYDWVYGTGGEKFLSNIPAATLPSERINTPFIVEVEGSGNSTTVYVSTSSTLQNSASFTASVTDPEGMTTTKTLTFDSGAYFATFSTDVPGRYSVIVDYSYNGLSYHTETDFSVSYYAEYDSFTNYSKSYMYKLLTESGEILELDEIKEIENNASTYTTYMFRFTLPLMIVSAIAFVADIIIRQLRWKDVTSFFSGLVRRRK